MSPRPGDSGELDLPETAGPLDDLCLPWSQGRERRSSTLDSVPTLRGFTGPHGQRWSFGRAIGWVPRTTQESGAGAVARGLGTRRSGTDGRCGRPGTDRGRRTLRSKGPAVRARDTTPTSGEDFRTPGRVGCGDPWCLSRRSSMTKGGQKSSLRRSTDCSRVPRVPVPTQEHRGRVGRTGDTTKRGPRSPWANRLSVQNTSVSLLRPKPKHESSVFPSFRGNPPPRRGSPIS